MSNTYRGVAQRFSSWAPIPEEMIDNLLQHDLKGTWRQASKLCLKYQSCHAITLSRNLYLKNIQLRLSSNNTVTVRLQYEDDYEYEFSVLSTRFWFGGRKFSKCACSELKTRARSRPRTPIWRSLIKESTSTWFPASPWQSNIPTDPPAWLPSVSRHFFPCFSSPNDMSCDSGILPKNNREL